MTNTFQLLQGLLVKYRVSEPVPEAVRRRVINSRRRNLIQILKKLNRYSPLLGAIIIVYFLFKKLGISVTLVQSTIILFTVSALSVAGISTGSYVTAKIIIERATTVEIQEQVDETPSVDVPQPMDTPESVKKQDVSAPVMRDVKNIIHIQSFDNIDSQDKDVSLVMTTIRNELSRLRGIANIHSEKTESQSGRLLLLGSVRKHGSLYSVSAKIVDSKTGRIIFAASEETGSAGLVKTSKKIAGEISESIE